MRELLIGDGPLEAVLLPEAGARLHRLRAFGHDLLRTPPDPAEHLGSLAAPADGLDGTWTDATIGAIELAWPELDVRATIRASVNARYVAVATPPDLDAVAVEPQTHAPDGLRRLLEGRSDGLAWLPAGESLVLDLEIQVSRV